MPDRRDSLPSGAGEDVIGRARIRSAGTGARLYGQRRRRLLYSLSEATGPDKAGRTMKHADGAALANLSELLDQIRSKAGIKEKKLGIFYRKSKSFLHFHVDAAGLFADLRTGADFERYPVNTRHEWSTLLSAIDRAIKS
jgi:hypothetical protein